MVAIVHKKHTHTRIGTYKKIFLKKKKKYNEVYDIKVYKWKIKISMVYISIALGQK